jgi:choice-of-anchor A domain-containing protein
MIRHLALTACILAGLASAPAFAAGNAAAGLQAMKETNLIVLHDMTAGHDVEGKVIIGNDLNGNSATFGLGNHANGQSAASSSRPTLTVGHNNNVQNVNLNEAGSSFSVGGSSKNVNLNGGGNHKILVGGNLDGNFNVGSGTNMSVGGNVNGSVNGSSGGVAQIGGFVNGNTNTNGASITTNMGIGFNNAASTITSQTSQLSEDVKALSTALKGLSAGNPALADFNAATHTLTLNSATAGSAGYAVFNIDGALLSSSTYTELVYNFSSTTLPVIVNVSGTNVNFHLNPTGTSSANNQQIIWNFYEASTVDFTRMMHGSVLAPYATLSNNTPIEGSVVAYDFKQGGEVHLGTYNGSSSFLAPVPEPKTWAMMIGGFMLAGLAMRRRTAVRLAD